MPATRLRRLALLSVAVAVALVSPLLTVTGASAAPAVHDAEWYIDRLDLTQAQRLATGRGVTVAVVDSGVDGTQRDLAGGVVRGVDLTDPRGDGWRDTNGHGTSMAGIIAGRGGVGDHALGVAPGARILPVKIGDGADLGDDAEARGIRAAVDRGARIVNLSIGQDGPAPAVVDAAVRYALRRGVVLVAAAGNAGAGDTGVTNPADIPGVVAVTGVGRNGYFWSGSVSGPAAALSGPAEDIVTAGSTLRHGGGYARTDGTSCASAFVSGLAALVWSRYPRLDAANVINRMLRTATDGGAPGRDPLYGYGGLNVMRALTAPVPAVRANPLLASPHTAAPGDDRSAAMLRARGPSMRAGLTVLAVLLAVALVAVVGRTRRRLPARRAAAPR